MHPLLPSLHRATALIVFVVAASACDELQPLRPEVESQAASSPGYEVTNPDSSWDRYSADVSITIEADPAPDSLGILPKTYRMHLERLLQGDGSWNTTATFPRAAESPVTSLARARITSEGIALFDHGGQALPLADRAEVLAVLPPGMPLQIPAPPDRPGDGGDRGGGGRPVADSALPPATGVGGRVAGPVSAADSARVRSGREWSDQLVVSRRSRERVLAAVRARLGDPAGRMNGLGRYVRADRHGSVTELLVDETRGVVVQENLATGGRLRFHARHAYRESAGRLERAATRVQFGPGVVKASRRRLAMEIRYDNVRLTREGQ